MYLGKRLLVVDFQIICQILEPVSYTHLDVYKRQFDESVNGLPSVIVSAGKIGYQIECVPADLIGLVRAKTAAITTD